MKVLVVFGTRPEDCLAAIGPGIGPEEYEVDEKVFCAFHPEDGAVPGVFTPARPHHWLLDTTAAVQHQLRTAGIPDDCISVSPWRTHIHTDLLFSHRLHPGCPRLGAFFGILAI